MTGAILLPSNPRPNQVSGKLPGLAASLVVNTLCPYLIYQYLKHQTALPEIAILLATGVPSMLNAAFGAIRRKRLDFLALSRLFTTIVTAAIVVALGGDPKLYLVRNSFLTLAYGLAMFVSLLFPRPLGFYAARFLFTANAPERGAGFDGLWHHEFFRHFIRVLTVAWGINLLAESSLHFYLIRTLSIPQYLVASHFVSYGCTGAILLWSAFYLRAWKARNHALLETLQAKSREFEGNPGAQESDQ